MGRDRSSNSGFTVIAAAAVAAAVAYWILSAQEAPTLPFAIAQYTLLASVLDRRPRRPHEMPRPPLSPASGR